MQPKTTMPQYVAEQISARLGRLVFEMHRSAKSLDPNAVHDLRVSIRRFSQSLRAFSSILPRRQTRKIRKRLRRMMRQAGEVRNRDIALQFLEKGGYTPRTALRSRIARERREQERALRDMLKGPDGQDFSSKWRSALRLETHEGA